MYLAKCSGKFFICLVIKVLLSGSSATKYGPISGSIFGELKAGKVSNSKLNSSALSCK